MYIPAFYLTVPAMKGETQEVIAENLSAGWWPSVKACWALWVPIQSLTFSVVPGSQRVAFVSGWNFIWTVALSYISNNPDPKDSHSQVKSLHGQP
jgi:hypothetical protein